MQLYNSLTQAIEPLEPQGGEFRLYACGITPYDTTHLGHAYTYATVDVLIRFLELHGTRVRYVQNVTDVDDDMLRHAAERQRDWRELGDRWTARFIEDMSALNIRPPDVLPRASSVIVEMIEHIQRLLDVGVAYRAGGGVYFEVEAWPRYGELSRLNPDQMLPVANERGNNPDDPKKRDPLDFVLWQPQAPGEPAWDSPWGRGRPGWHIECSTMAQTHLGETLDLHAGGEDLIFPHHESEIAQLEPVSQRPFARHWMHIAMLEYEGQKMSKSLGNLVLVRDLLDRWPPDAIRLYLAGHHYRSPWAHDTHELDQAATLVEVLSTALAASSGTGPALEPEAEEAGFIAAMEDDLHSPRAIEHLLRLADAITAAASDGREVEAAQRSLSELASVLGLRLLSEGPQERVVEGWRKRLGEYNGG